MRFADRMQYLRASEIRELLKLTERPEVISFAGGLPAPELFPARELGDILGELAREEGAATLQYGVTAGYGPLREAIARRMASTDGVRIDASQVLVTHGSQQGLDFAGRIFLDKGSVVLCESPTYLAAISAFRAYEPRFIAVPTDEDGMLPGALAEILAREPDVRMVYVIPDFQNPTGRTWSLERRKQLLALLSGTDIPIIEDNPYGELRFEGTALPGLQALDTCGRVIRLGTFSKILCPGLRIGWVSAAPDLIARFDLVKQGADLHTAQLTQACVARYLERHDINAHIATIRDTYRARRDAMLDEIRTQFGSTVAVNAPQGGLFLWMTLPAGTDARELLVRCLACNVAFVPGGSFFPEGGHENTLRLNFSNMPQERIREGVRRMADAFGGLPVLVRPAS